MPSDTATQQDTAARSTAPSKANRRVMLAMLVLAGLFTLGLLVSWHFMLPETSNSLVQANPKAVPGSLTQADVKEISNLCRRHTVGYSVDKLRRGQFGWFFRSTRILFKQKIDRLIDDRDGTYRAYVVVYDKQAPDGFNAWYRHQLTKTNGKWMILRSY